MSKFCGNCGAVMDDSAKICGRCGTPLNPTGKTAPKIPGLDKINITDDQKAKIKKYLPIVGGGVAAVVIVLVLIFGIIIPNTGANAVAKKIGKAFQNDDTDALCEIQSYLLDDYYIEDEDAAEDIYSSRIEDVYDIFDERFDDEDYKVTYEINKDKTKNYEDKKAAKELQELFNLDDDEKEDFEDDCQLKKMTIKITATAGKKDKDVKLTVYLIKDDGWKLLRLDINY